MKMEEFNYLSANGKTNIHAVKWTTDKKILGVIQVAHGVTEYILRYKEFAEFFTNLGFIVVGNDHLGHGKSLIDNSEKMYCGPTGSWKYIVEDIHTLTQKTKEEYPNVPYILLGFSLGSFAVRDYLQKYHKEIDGTILVGTGYNNPLILKLLLKLVNNEAKKNNEKQSTPLIHKLTFETYNQKFKPNRTEYDWLCANNIELDKYINDPNRGSDFSIGLFRELLCSMISTCNKSLINNIEKDIPILLISGGSDPVGNNGYGVKKVYKLYKKANISDVTLKIYPNLRHDILRETNSKDIMKYIYNWIKEKFKLQDI